MIWPTRNYIALHIPTGKYIAHKICLTYPTKTLFRLGDIPETFTAPVGFKFLATRHIKKLIATHSIYIDTGAFEHATEPGYFKEEEFLIGRYDGENSVLSNAHSVWHDD